jgi:hypothetical protein
MKRKLENSVENLMKISPKIKFLKTLAKFFNWKKRRKKKTKKEKKEKKTLTLMHIYKLKDDNRQ